MKLLYDTGQNAEVLTVNGTSTATNIPVAPAVRAHSASVTFGQLLISSTYSGTGQEQVPAVSPCLAGADPVAGTPVLAVALVTFPAHNEFTGLPPVQPGQVFWTDPDNVPALVAAGRLRWPRPAPPTRAHCRTRCAAGRGWALRRPTRRHEPPERGQAGAES
jgi:hypothetical protein